MSNSTIAVFLVLLAALSLVQGWRHAGRRPKRRRRRAGSASRPRARIRSTVGHDQWRRPGPRRKPRAIPGCDVYVYWPWLLDGSGPDRSGRSKYVGKALAWRERRNQHKRVDPDTGVHESPWWPEVYPHPDVQRCADERAALAREWYLIGELNPTENERRPSGWQRTGRPLAEVMAGFKPAPGTGRITSISTSTSTATATGTASKSGQTYPSPTSPAPVGYSSSTRSRPATRVTSIDSLRGSRSSRYSRYSRP